MQFFLANPIFIFTMAFVGLGISGILNIVIYRLPLQMQQNWHVQCRDFLKLPAEATTILITFWQASHCPSCQHTLRYYEIIPLVSYCWLRKVCAYCRQPIGFRYLLVEVLTIFITILLAWHSGPSWQLVAALPFFWGLLVLSVIDAEHQLLPDILTLSLLWLGIFANVFTLFTTLPMAVLGAIVGYSSLWFLAAIFKKIRKIEGIGQGDFKLFAMLGAWLGVQSLLLILLMASLLGAAVGLCMLKIKKQDRSTPLPFGPYLAIAGAVMFLW